MARAKFGTFGPLVGKLGNTIWYLRLGQPVTRMVSHPSTKPRSEKQIASSKAFSIVSSFVTPINSFLNMSMAQAIIKTQKVGRNEGMSLNLKSAVDGIYPNQELNYSKAIVGKGKLETATNPTADVVDNNPSLKIKQLKFSWEVNPAWGNTRRNDQVMMLAVMPEINKVNYVTSGARRQAGEDILEIYSFDTIHGVKTYATYAETYIVFISDDRKSVSNSIYTGRINLMP
nr:DUF6266 family protein [Pedobacter panaciterrae]